MSDPRVRELRDALDRRTHPNSIEWDNVLRQVLCNQPLEVKYETDPAYHAAVFALCTAEATLKWLQDNLRPVLEDYERLLDAVHACGDDGGCRLPFDSPQPVESPKWEVINSMAGSHCSECKADLNDGGHMPDCVAYGPADSPINEKQSTRPSAAPPLPYRPYG